MCNRVATTLLLLTACGCAGRPLLNVRAPSGMAQPAFAAQASRLQPAVARGAAEMAPVIIPGGDRARAWNQVVDVVDDHFNVVSEAHGQLIGDNLLTAGQIDAASGISRRGFVRMVPVETGFLLDVTIFKEVADSNLPPPLTVQTAGLSEDRPFETLAGAEAGDAVSPHWIPAGRDEALEDDLLSEVRSRLDGTWEPPPQPATYGDLGPPDRSLSYLYRRTKKQVWNDHKNFYSLESLGKLAAGVGVAALLANTQSDREMAEAYEDHVRNSSTNSFAKMVKPFGDGSYTIPVYAAAAILGEVFDAEMLVVGQWGNRSLRATGVGFPLMLLLQKATGSARPNDHVGSHWNPWKDNHGVSGHAFMGAVPFLTAAQMTEDPYWKAAFYFGSTLTAWSRVNDGAHFFSQVALGWWMAYLATSAVDLTNLGMEGFSIAPMPIGDGLGVGIEFLR